MFYLRLAIGRRFLWLEAWRGGGIMVFRDREEGAEKLAERLKDDHVPRPLVLAIPRGAVPMASIIADALDGDLDVVLVHKISPSWQPELAVGAVTEEGDVILNRVARSLGMRQEDISDAVHAQIDKLRERRKMYTPYHKPINPRGRTVIIVDDGIATGATMTSAVQYMQKKGASRIIAAAPVASEEALELLRSEGAELCILDVPRDFYSVSQFYESFSQVEDEEVIRIISGWRETPRKGGETFTHAPF
jgi:putative phosphoribosyl transferase